MPRFVLGALALAASVVAPCAQVPVGSAVIGVLGNTAPSEGLFLADRTGACVGITGLVAAGNAGSNVNAVALDPIDHRVWIASTSSAQVNWIRIAGTSVVQWSPNANPFAAVQVAPMILNGGLGPFDLAIGTTAPRGTLAVVGTAFPTVFLVGVAVVGVDGRLSVSLPNVTLTAPLAQGSLQFVAAYFDLQGGPTIGSPVSWPSL